MAEADGAIAPEKDNQSSETEAAGLLKARVDELRTTVMTRFAEVALAMSTVPRYASLSVGDLQAFALTPLVKERIAIAQSKPSKDGLARTEGIAIWAFR
jgi:uncharacterized protein YqfA (UPF0365 family)